MSISRVEFRMSADLKREVEEAAALLGASFTAFATQALIERARVVKQEHNLTLLRDEARDALIDMITNPPQPSEALKKTMSVRSVEL